MTLEAMMSEDRYYSAEVTEAIAKERDDLRAERDRLREALKEALEELDSLVQRETMSQSKWSQHTVWMEWLRSALEEAGDEK